MPVERPTGVEESVLVPPEGSSGPSPFTQQLRALYQRSARARALANRAAAAAAVMRHGAHAASGGAAPSSPHLPHPEDPCDHPMTIDEDPSGLAAAAANAAGAARVAAALRRPPESLVRGGRPGDRPGNPYRPFLGGFSALVSAERAWGSSGGPGTGSGGGAAARWRAWGSSAAGAAGRGGIHNEDPWGEDDEDSGPPGITGSEDPFDDEDEDCPGLVDDEEEEEEEDEETEEDFDAMAGAGGTSGAAAAIDRAFTLSWRRMLMPPGHAGRSGADGAARGAARRRVGEAAAAGDAAPARPATLAAPQPCSFLRPGMRFSGVQRLSNQLPSSRRQDDWAVTVVIEGVDHEAGTVCGTMQALNVPGASSTPIVTFWEGHVVDDVRFSFFTRGAPGWGPGAPGREVDLKHWGKFEGFAQLRSDVVRQGGRSGALERHPWVYMRWKEQFFVGAGQDVGLTIAGFYYVALCRKTGRVHGYYYDPHSSPFQSLELEPMMNGRGHTVHKQQQQQQQQQQAQQQSQQQAQQQQGAPAAASVVVSGRCGAEAAAAAPVASPAPAASCGGYVFTSAWRHT